MKSEKRESAKKERREKRRRKEGIKRRKRKSRESLLMMYVLRSALSLPPVGRKVKITGACSRSFFRERAPPIAR